MIATASISTIDSRGEKLWVGRRLGLAGRKVVVEKVAHRQLLSTHTMRRPQHNTTSLPRHLRSELGIRDTYGDKKRKQTGPALRKERRQAERTGKKSRPQAPPAKKQKFVPSKAEDDIDLDSDEELFNEDVQPTPKTKSKTTLKESQRDQKSESEDDFDLNEDDDEDESEEDIADEPHVPSGVKSKLAQDDAEIAALEKKLGLKKGKKLPKAFAEDGLDDLMGDLAEGSDDEGRKRKREADEWLQSKRQKAQAQKAQQEDDDSEMDSEDEDNLDDEIFGSDDDDEEMEGDEDEEDEFDGFDEEKAPPKKKENPYVAPVPKVAAAQKYIPPSLRAVSDPESESLIRLKRQAQGHLNKMSEANLISILTEFEKLYRDYPRQHVTSTIINLLMGLICERSVLQDTFLVLHAGFIAGLYRIMGMDVGAELVQRVVETLDAGGDERGTFEGKEATNLVSLLAQLYNFHVIGSPLMFDYIRSFLQEITESNTELLLKVIRSK